MFLCQILVRVVCFLKLALVLFDVPGGQRVSQSRLQVLLLAADAGWLGPALAAFAGLAPPWPAWPAALPGVAGRAGAHGGSISTALDDGLGAAVLRAEGFGFPPARLPQPWA